MYRAARKGTRHVRHAIQLWQRERLPGGPPQPGVPDVAAARGALAAEVIGRPAVNVAIFAFFVMLTLVIALRDFFLGWLGSVTGRQPSDPARFARIQARALTGAGAERGGHS